MPVRSSALGAELGQGSVDVTARMTLAYAAGIGDLGPRTFDDAGPEPLLASPPFCVCLEWPVLLRGRGAVLGLLDEERLRAVHVGQDSTFHRPIRAGERLTTSARVVAIRATRAGAFVETRLHTAAAGEPVVTSWHGSLYRGVAVDAEGGRAEQPPAFPAAIDALPARLSIRVPRQAAHVYTECSGIWNPIHTERRVALRVGLPDVILHGTASWAIAGVEIAKAHAGGDSTRLLRLRARFQAPIVPGGEVSLEHGSGTPGQVHFRMANERGELALAEGYAEIAP